MGRVAVTGGCGFIGRAICKRLEVEGHEVVELDNGFRHGNGTGDDVRNMRADSFEGCDTVVHAAWINGTRHFYERPWQVIEVGIEGTMRALRCAAMGVKNFHFISSSEVHCATDEFPTPETTPVGLPDIRNPRFSYGGAKIAAELMVLNCPWIEHVTITRPNNVYGPGMGCDHVVPQLLDKVKAGQSVEVQGGDQTRTFCYIDDFVDGFMKVYDFGAHREIYNVGGDQEIAIRDLVKLMGRVVGRSVKQKSIPVPVGDAPRRRPSIQKLVDLGYWPKVPLEEGIRRCM